ncbi:response regulator [Desulfobulbus alkaliphilus]|uniref:response regulator n=1 Tax=Desulfobulbus alkaliphilus TaxID=869814 RepID=UPI001F052F4D|nr:response regulator [Desulfobulbus alkaliphilus]
MSKTESSLAVFSGLYCLGEEVVSALAGETGLRVVGDHDLILAAANRSGFPESTIARVFSSKQSVFDKFTHEKKRAHAYLRLVLAELMDESRLLLTGYCTHLVPWGLTHLLRSCLIANTPFRVQQAIRAGTMSQAEAEARIIADDAEKSQWTATYLQNNNPWDAELYDILLPMGQFDVEQAVSMLCDQLNRQGMQPSQASRQALADFQLAARASVVLVRAGHDGEVKADDGVLTVSISMKVLMFNRLQEELHTLLHSLPGVKSVKVQIEPEARNAGMYRKYDQNVPSKVLLVDDEQEFVQTLSERLLFRNVGTAVAHDGRSALEMLVDDDPDVLVLDLKMPGMDGIEVLRRVKKIRPAVEVIILTGHGSDIDRKACMELGAFAYLQKPVDIDLLSGKLTEAHERVKNSRANS